jgi:hypothetical protein
LRKGGDVNKDAEHLNLLALFHYILGALVAVFACIPFIHLGVGIAMLCGAFDDGNGPPRSFGLFFVVIATVVILAGWALAILMLIAGRCLKRRVRRTFCFVVAGMECLFQPLGVILGVFTIIVLMRDSVKELFEREPVLLKEADSMDARP